MNSNLENLVYRWLQLMKISVSGKYIKEKLLSHPDYPSLVSITDTLDELNIENGAFVVGNEKLNEIPVPFLAHTVAKGGEFELITNIDEHIKHNPGFEKQWDGIAVMVEKPVHFENFENEKILYEEKRNRQILWLFIILISGLSLYSLGVNFYWQYTGLLLTILTGLSVAVLIMQQELGISNEFTEQLCAAGKNVDCHAVMSHKTNGAKSATFLKWVNPLNIGLADATIIYFASLFILLTISLFYGTMPSFVPVYFLIAALSLPVTLFSIYYQWRVVKKWCLLCLATVAVLWIQFGLLLGAEPGTELVEVAKGIFAGFSTTAFLFTLFICFSIAALWLLLLKPALQKNIELNDKNFSLLRFKNNPDVFNALLQTQRKVNTTPFEHDLQLGNPDAELQIMVACNPYCGPCAKAHEILDELLQKNDIGLTVRFMIKTDNKEERRLQAVQYILRLAKNKPNTYLRKLLHDWYADMDFEKFSRKHPLDEGEDVYEILKQQEKWSEESEIKFTPTIFINGHELPKQFNANDLKIMFRAVERIEGDRLEKYIEENELIPV